MGNEETADASSETISDEPWYSARLLFGWYVRGSDERIALEERVVLISADDFESAIQRAEIAAEKYAREFSGDSEVRYEGFCDVFHLYEATLGDGAELYSKVIKSPLTPVAFFDRFFDPHGED